MPLDDIDTKLSEIAAVIGDHKGNDHVLTPSEHAELYAESAPALAAILQSPAVATAAETYEQFDAKARTRQQRFKVAANRANALLLGTAICGALVIATGVLEAQLGESLAKGLAIGLAIAALIIGAAASAYLYSAKSGGYLTKWMRSRAEAEVWRLRYFQEVTAGSDPDGRPYATPLLLLKLQYFVRYQLAVQVLFYNERGDDHERSAARSLRFAAVAVALSAIVTGISGMLSIADMTFVAFGAIGVIASALTAFASARESINQDQRNAERYERTFETLTKLKLNFGAVQRAIVKLGPKPLTDFVEAVNEQLALEHREWLDDAAQASSALKSLENTLRRAEGPAKPEEDIVDGSG